MASPGHWSNYLLWLETLLFQASLCSHAHTHSKFLVVKGMSPASLHLQTCAHAVLSIWGKTFFPFFLLRIILVSHFRCHFSLCTSDVPSCSSHNHHKAFKPSLWLLLPELSRYSVFFTDSHWYQNVAHTSHKAFEEQHAHF